MSDPASDRLDEFYRMKLAVSGPTPQGVDCSQYGQEERFRQLLKIVDSPEPYSLLDYGCGYGELLRFFRRDAEASGVAYQGYDVVEPMIASAHDLFADVPARTFTTVRAEVQPADFVVASGIFNKNFGDGQDDWRAHIERTLDDIASLAIRGFAFNMLTIYSDADKMRDDLYYGDPHHFFRYCRKYSRHVALLHDYHLYDFTILVRKRLPDRIDS